MSTRKHRAPSLATSLLRTAFLPSFPHYPLHLSPCLPPLHLEDRTDALSQGAASPSLSKSPTAVPDATCAPSTCRSARSSTSPPSAWDCWARTAILGTSAGAGWRGAVRCPRCRSLELGTFAGAGRADVVEPGFLGRISRHTGYLERWMQAPI